MNTSYKNIFRLSVPIMLGSAAQNIIVLSDSVFLFHYDATDFAAAGLVGVFYLIIASIGYGFSRGGQILIARREGENNLKGAGVDFQALVIFELFLAITLFVFLQLFSRPFFTLFLNDPVILEKCVDYIQPRSWGVFFSYLGVSMIAFYTGIGRTRFIIWDTIVLIVVNLVLNYVFIFGKWGMEPMGIKGAGLASTIAEVVAFVVFISYMLTDRLSRPYSLLKINRIALRDIRNMFVIASPIVFQSILGIGSWFLFFSFIENMGKTELAISNILRTVYLILSIPCWGYSAGINTLVSQLIGYQKRQAVLPIIIKTTKLNLFTTLIISLPVVIFPEFFLYPLFGKEDMTLILAAKPYMAVLFGILVVFGVGGIFFNGLIGTGHTQTALRIQTIFTVFYIIYTFLVIKQWQLDLNWAWAAEIFYWAGILIMSVLFLRTKKWHFLDL